MARLRRILKWVIAACIILFVAAILLHSTLAGRGYTGEIRLDCGDLRYPYHGCTIYKRSTPEPDRTKLLALAAKTSIPKETWSQFTVPALKAWDRMYRNAYRRVVPWIEIDPELAKLLLEDLAGYMQRLKQHQGGLPSISILDGCYEKDGQNAIWPARIRSDWQKDEFLQNVIHDPFENETPVVLYLRAKLANDRTQK
ncbi:MAG TPA: hypothetical protein PLI09_10865 [Candidatus Hydrogenedentes bacterium]|nr:hypothetical protein [Candidatus Hydrogenedentota bacterium]